MAESSTTATVTASIFDDCDDSCGWIAAVVAALAYGSYGVPIKASVQIDVHPLVLQSFKSFTMFNMCWLVRFLGIKAVWTPWGLVSGLLWVIGGTCGIYAIRAAGMAVAVGTWASTMICVNFYWGIVVFKEPVADFWGAVGAFVCLAIGLVGMSHFSAPREKEKVEQDQELQEPLVEEQDEHHTSHPMTSASTCRPERRESALRQDVNEVHQGNVQHSPPSSADIDVSRFTSSGTVVILGHTFSKRVAGLVAAVGNGLFAGSSLIPVHYAKQHGFAGANYMISFAVGALSMNTALWLVIFLYYYCRRPLAESRFKQAYKSMPHWHLRELWLPGLMAGILVSIAMFGSILTVTFLGQGIGNSVIQAKILISGLWGIFWYKEITGCSTVSKWFLAAFTAVVGILWLSYQRLAGARGDMDGDHRW